MDPDAALDAIRSMVSDVLAGENGDADDTLDMLAETFRGLDEWLSRGGFLPAAWQH